MKKLGFALLLLLNLTSEVYSKSLVLTIPSDDEKSAREVYIEYIGPKKNDLPMLLLGPGVNRGLLPGDKFIRAIKERGFSYVALHFSTLPHSVSAMGAKETAYFEVKDFEIADYAYEMEAVGQWMRNHFKREVVPVSLSFSGAPSSLLKSFPLVIDIAPMTSLQDARPQLAYYLNTLRAANFFNPFGGSVIRAAMDQSYSLVWRPKTEEMIEGFRFDPELEDKIYEGYMTSSRSLEDFKWDSLETPKEVKRVLILGEDEDEDLLEGQVSVLKDTQRNKRKVNCFFVRGAPHAVSFAKPRTTAKIVEAVIRGKVNESPGCYDVSSINSFDFLDMDEFEGILP